eukprot:760859-Hanusia_phi.AAC.4
MDVLTSPHWESEAVRKTGVNYHPTPMLYYDAILYIPTISTFPIILELALENWKASSKAARLTRVRPWQELNWGWVSRSRRDISLSGHIQDRLGTFTFFELYFLSYFPLSVDLDACGRLCFARGTSVTGMG